MIRQRLAENPDRLLTRFGIFLGVLAVFYFGREAIFDLTPLAKCALLVIGSAFFLGGSKLVDETSTVVALYLFSAVSYLTFLGYYTLRMDPSTNTVFLLLAVSGIIFTVIGKKIDEYEIERDRAKKVGGVLLVASLALIAVDLNAPEVEYKMQFENSIEIGESPVKAGNVTARNSYILPQTYSAERIETCSTDESRIRIMPEDRSKTSGIIDGLSEKSIEYEFNRIPRAPEENATAETFTVVESNECPEDPESSTIYVYQVPSFD
ncbi:MAG: hypothetical protein ACI8Z7_000949 [Candidatus Nanohaloarchaea archaeon]|jgi:hypothetical protein